MLIAIFHVATESWFFLFFFVCLYFIEGPPPIPGERELWRKEGSRKGMSYFVKRGIQSLQEKEYNA